MKFLKNIVINFRLLFLMGKNDFKNKYLGSGLGSVWGFVNPIAQLLTYTFVYQVIFKTNSDIPFIVTFFPVLTVWMFISETMVSTTTSIKNHSYLVKKIKFPIDIIPLIPVISAYIVFLALNIFVIIINTYFGYAPNIFLLIYLHFCVLMFIVSFGRMFSALNTIIPDISHFISSSMQILFWISPILWSFSAMENRYKILLRLNPLSYIIDGFRAIYIPNYEWFDNVFEHSILFWAITLFLFIYGNYIFNKAKKDFADNI